MAAELNHPAPDFTLPDSHGNHVTLSSFQGKSNVVLIMYPGDNTPGCTAQLCSVRDNYADFEKYHAVVLGINHADAASHNKFIESHGLRNPLLVDEGRQVIKKYGSDSKFLGVESTRRTVVIVDKQGIIRYLVHGLPPHEELKKQLEMINEPAK